MKRLFKTLVYSTLALGTCSFTVASLVGEEPFAAPKKVTQLNRQGVGIGGVSGRPLTMPNNRTTNPVNTLFGGSASSTSGNTQGNTQGGNTQGGNTQGSGSTAGGFSGSATSGGGGGLQAFGFGASGGTNITQPNVPSITPVGIMPNTLIGYIGGSGGGNFGGGFQGFAGTTGTQGGGVQGVQGIGVQNQGGQNGQQGKIGMNGNLGI